MLLVEDDSLQAGVMTECLRSNGLGRHLTVLTSGNDALAFLHREDPFAGAARPDLILLDLGLPDRSGADVLDEVKSDVTLRDIPVVVLSHSDAPDQVDRAYAAGANCFVRKPATLAGYLSLTRAIREFWGDAVTLPSSARHPRRAPMFRAST